MNPCNFPEANSVFHAPEDFEVEQVASIPAYQHEVQGGTCDGVQQVVVAWMPTPAEIAVILAGNPIYVSMLGGLSAHMVTTDFYAATHPA